MDFQTPDHRLLLEGDLASTPDLVPLAPAGRRPGPGTPGGAPRRRPRAGRRARSEERGRIAGAGRGRARSLDEVPLLGRLRRGDASAFAALVTTHEDRMLAVARRFFVEEEDARDAVQDAFLAAHRAIGRFEGQAQLSTWLHRIVVNACLMKLRTRRRRPEQPLVEAPSWSLIADEEDRADLRLERRQTRARLRDAIDGLAEPHRRVLELRDLEGRDTRETARLLGVTPGAVKTRLHRARAALRDRIEGVACAAC
ncbi:MAG TPA: sigma-70 family RNA polymerase sigma factor [Myxococcota bacterium]|nr:sigma-70 family RNA polymerase sigma factor [Myxococcota bacterium]